MIKLLYSHTEYLDEVDENGEQKSFKPGFDEFKKYNSSIDKLSLLWGLYKSTYETVDKEKEIECEQCSNKYKIDISSDELIHEDTYTIWEQENDNGEIIPFWNYRYNIPIEYGDVVYEFSTKLPSMEDNNILLSMLSNDSIQQNLETTGNIFTKPQQMGLLIDTIKISSKSGSFEEVQTSNIHEILLALQKHIPSTVSDSFFKQYGDHFNKYVPSFYKLSTCPSCNYNNRTEVDLEVEFFRRSLYGGESSE